MIGHTTFCLLHRRQRPCVLVRDVRPDTSFSDREEEIQQLWLGFCRSISIEARENQALQQQMLPLRFRKWMTEERNLPDKFLESGIRSPSLQLC